MGLQTTELKEQIYLPYGNYLVMNDRFEEAQEYYTKAGRPQEAIKVLKFLADGSIVQERFELAAYYYWCLSKSTLANYAKQGTPTVKKDQVVQTWKQYCTLSTVYFAYFYVHQYISDPFTFSSPSTLMNAAKLVLQIMQDLPLSLPGISRVYVYYCLAKISSQVGCQKLSQQSYQKLQSLHLPSKWQNTVDLATMLIKSKPSKDSEEYNQICGQCNFSNPVIGGFDCLNCYEPFVYSFYSFEALPIVKFLPDEGLSEEDIENLLTSESPDDIPFDDFSNRVFGKIRDDNGYSPIVFQKPDLLDCDPRRVYTIERTSNLLPKEYYFLNSTEIYVKLCSSCYHFFAEDEWNYQILMEGCCPFCRCKGEISS